MSIKGKYKPSYKKRKNRKGVFIVSSVLLLLSLIVSSIFLITTLKKGDKASKENSKIRITAYVAKEEIKTGQAITTAMLSELQIEPIMQKEYYLSMKSIGEIAITDIPKGMLLLSNMCKTPMLDNDQREVECEIISLSSNLSENDYVDVRIMLPNGEDYIVLSKKSVHEVTIDVENNENSCYLWLSEDEILFYSAAIVDAYLYTGASLYTTKYIEPTIQEASKVTYVPSMNTLTMIRENPNMVTIAATYLQDNRKRLENRLTDYLNKDVKEVLWEDGMEPFSPLEDENIEQIQPNKEEQVESKKEQAEQEQKQAEQEQKTEESANTQTGEKNEKKKDEEALSVFIEDINEEEP